MYAGWDAAIVMKRALQHVLSAANLNAVIENFYASPSTMMFDEIGFDPRTTGQSVINLWTGPTVSGIPGAFPIIQHFIDEVIANGDSVVATYLMDFLAHMLQRPEEKPRVMPVLMGGQGTGKGTFSKLLQSIWSLTTLITNRVADVTGDFNSALDQKFVVWLDEAVFAGDVKTTEALKSLITEPTISIHAKHKEPRNTFSCHRFFAATNAGHFARTAHDDRRFVYLPVSERYKGNQAYWDAFNAGYTEELPALVDHLQSRDLTSFDPTKRPGTPMLVDQKLKSLTGFEKWWHDVLQNGELAISHKGGPLKVTELSNFDPVFVGTKDLTNSYETFAKAHNLQERSLDTKTLKDRLNTVCPSAKDDRKKLGGSLTRGYEIPALGVARKDFENFIGAALQWPP
jgi:hypothetical protein